MTQGATRLPCRGTTGHRHSMSNSKKERGEKRGVVDTGRAKQLDTDDADADAADDSDEG